MADYKLYETTDGLRCQPLLEGYLPFDGGKRVNGLNELEAEKLWHQRFVRLMRDKFGIKRNKSQKMLCQLIEETESISFLMGSVEEFINELNGSGQATEETIGDSYTFIIQKQGDKYVGRASIHLFLASLDDHSIEDAILSTLFHLSDEQIKSLKE